MQHTTIREKLLAWITPSLVIIVGWFAKNKLEDIDAKLSLIPQIQNSVTINATNIQAITTDVNNLRGQFMQHVDLAAKSEEDITLEKLQKTK